MRAGSGSRRAFVGAIRPAWGLNGPFGFGLAFFWVCFLGGAGAEAFVYSGGPLASHQFVFSWPDALLFDFWSLAFVFLCAFCAIRHASAPLLRALNFFLIFSTVFAGALFFPVSSSGGSLLPAIPLFFFGWGSLPHATLLLWWRELTLITLIWAPYALKALQTHYSRLLGFGFWAGIIGALWALAATTPPLLWAGDGIELATLAGLLVFVGWVHLWPTSKADLSVLALIFPASLLLLQGLGTWTFHHDSSFSYAATSPFATSLFFGKTPHLS